MTHSIETLAAVAECHAYNRDWYSRHVVPAYALLGSEAALYRFEAFLAATSPRMTLKRNTRAAMECEHLSAVGSDPTAAPTAMATHAPNIARAAAGYPLSGPKVSAFERNLHGDWRVPTIDVHMLRLLDLRGSYARQVREAQGIVALVAAHLEWTPAEAQACLWAYQYRQTNKTIAIADFGAAITTLVEGAQ